MPLTFGTSLVDDFSLEEGSIAVASIFSYHQKEKTKNQIMQYQSQCQKNKALGFNALGFSEDFLTHFMPLVSLYTSLKH